MTTLAQFKAEFAEHYYSDQRGPNAIEGYERDAAVCREVRKARTWNAVAIAIPGTSVWSAAAANYCLPREL